ncbi:hypothetical protein GCM10020000_47510 [Streptomyces olivoverticillatus]
MGAPGAGALAMTSPTATFFSSGFSVALGCGATPFRLGGTGLAAVAAGDMTARPVLWSNLATFSEDLAA